MTKSKNKDILWFEEINLSHLPQVGGKNSSLGEMISLLSNSGISVPGGFATTADAFRYFLRHADLESKINEKLEMNIQNLIDNYG